ncbi:hypothetical protein EDB19DRAFT_1706216 [Suillus lakei]|nr:hypothetical protein EDB19DRAFT_1706216 [Suillus lakei]
MHPALQLNDIIYVIFRHVNDPSLSFQPGGNVGQTTLAALARTCQTFHEPALDVLWEDLYFPHPLVYCLPYPSNEWRLEYRTNALTTGDWEVLQKYVPRVRSLTFHAAAPLCRNVLKALRQSPIAQPPLPNLQRLDYRHFMPEDYPLLDIFFVPSLTDLTIEVHPATFPDISFISPLATLCPHLTSFRLFGYGLPHLQTLHCDQLSQAAITFVAWHLSLTELDISIPSGHPYNFSQFLHPTLPRIPPFSRIKSFGMNSIHLTTITAFIKAIQPSPSHLRITTSHALSPENLEEFFGILSNQWRHASLQILQLESSLPGASIDIDTIKPLLRFSNLRELHLLMGNPVRFSDEELATMGASWPGLEVINLNDGDTQVDPSITTLRGLILLVNKCPLLRSAHLAINTNVLEGIEERPTSMVGANDLQHLVLAGTPVENPRAVAFIVSLAFPKVKKIAVGGWRNDERHFGKVNEYLEMFRLVRGGRWIDFVDT